MNRKFTCVNCNKGFSRKISLTAHISRHVSVRFCKCLLCNKSVRSNLKRHMMLHLVRKHYQCELCKKAFSNKHSLTGHLMLHIATELRPLDCHICHKKFVDKFRLNRHLLRHSMEKHFQCEMCHVRFQDRFSWLRHKSARCGFTHCQVCNKVFLTKQAYKQHKARHSVKKSYFCSICSKTFTNSKSLKWHELVHNQVQCLCDQCNKSFKSIIYLRKHLLIHNVSKSDSYTCPVCSKRFTQEYLLKKHQQRVHVERKPCICVLCNKSFKNSDSIRNHLQRHIILKPKAFTCQACHKSFTENYLLKNHQLIHAFEKKYRCDICDKSFRTKYSQDLHSTIHSENRNYQCSLCDKSFQFRNRFQIHMTSHSQGNKLLCNLCCREFRNSHTLQKHKKLHCRGVAYWCTLCQVGLPYKYSLIQHQLWHCEQASSAHKCDTCNKSFSSPHKMIHHECVPSTVGPINGDESLKRNNILLSKKSLACKDFFKSFHYGDRHNDIHTQSKMLDSFCSKPQQIKKHQSLSDLEQPFFNEVSPAGHRSSTFVSCEECGLFFTSEFSLRQHGLIHSAQKPPHYHQVGNERLINFSTKFSVSDKPFHCQICQKTHWVMEHFDKHMLIHSRPRLPENVFCCYICTQSFDK
ncbi:hypothetical protein Btru_066229, partial [Bulinus truncatus]